MVFRQKVSAKTLCQANIIFGKVKDAMSSEKICKICNNASLIEFQNFQELHQVTSDCKPWPPGGRLAICSSCSHVQKITDQAFFETISDIYGNYTMFHQADGVEQSVRSSTDGVFEKRSTTLCKYLDQKLGLAKTGKLLDVGCATGGTLSAFNLVKPQWGLYGHDLGVHYMELLKKIPGFVELFSGEFDAISGQYNLLTIIHALEHFINPVEALKQLAQHIAESGSLFIQIPNAEINPFDLLIADHVSHFSLSTLKMVFDKSGYAPQVISDKIIDKEISALAEPFHSQLASYETSVQDITRVQNTIQEQIKWLGDLKQTAIEISARDAHFAIFGTSISGTWLASIIDENVDFFVDEDTARIGRTHMGRPVLSPDQIPEGTEVYVPLVPFIAEKVCARLSSPIYTLHRPPSHKRMKLCA
jgi:2-polyprenyl-3-methyl-5-hydroxy-6-metoxy-1,4-benzoquinol methylase